MKMATNLSSAIVIFTLLCFALVSSALGDNLASYPDDSPKNSAKKDPFALFDNRSSRRVSPSAWSKEENGNLMPSDYKNIGNKEQGLFGGEFNLWNLKKFFQYVESLLYTVPQNDDGSSAKSSDDAKIKMQNPNNNDPVGNSEKNSKTKRQDLFGEEFNLWNIKKYLKYVESLLYAVIQSDDGSSAKSTDGVKVKIKNPENNNPLDNSEKKAKNTIQNSAKINTLNKSADDSKMQNSVRNILNKYSGDIRKKQNQLSNGSLHNKQPTENSKMKMGKIINKETSKKPKDNVNIQNHSYQSGSTLKSGKPKEGPRLASFEDIEDNNIDEITSDYITAYDKYEEEDEYYDYTDFEIEDEEYTDEDDMIENEIDRTYVDDYDYDNEDNIYENEAENDYANEYNYNNEYNMNEDEIEDDYVNVNNYENHEDETGSSSQNPESTIVDNRARKNTTTFPNFIIKTKPGRQIYSEIHPPKNRIHKNDSIIPTDAKSQNKAKDEKPSPVFVLTDGEFIDDYINRPRNKIPEKTAKKSNNTETFIPSGSGATSKIISMQNPTTENNFEGDTRSSTTIPSIDENTKNLTMPSNQSQNIENRLKLEKNVIPLPIFDRDTKYTNSDQLDFSENSPQNIQNAFKSVDKPASTAKESRKSNEVEPPDLFNQNLHYGDLPYTFPTPRKDYNAVTVPSNQDFQNYNPSIKAHHNNAPDMNVNKPEILNQFQPHPNKAVLLQNEDYLNQQYANYAFQDVKNPDINQKIQQLEQKQPIVFEQDMLSNFQYVPNQNTPNSPDEVRYSTNYKPEVPINAPNIENPVRNTEIADNLPLSMQNQSDNLPFQDTFPGLKIQFPLSDTEKQSDMNKRIPPDENKISPKLQPAQDELKSIYFPLPQTKKLEIPPHHSFNNTEINLESVPKKEASSPVTGKSSSPQTKTLPNEPLNHDLEGNDEPEDLDEDDTNSDCDYDREYDEEESEEATSLSDKIKNEEKIQITQIPSSTDASYITESSVISEQNVQNEAVAANKKNNFNTILEYIYNSSNNSFFKGLKHQTNEK